MHDAVWPVATVGVGLGSYSAQICNLSHKPISSRAYIGDHSQTKQAVRLAPDDVGWYENLATYSVALQRFGEARQIIHEAYTKKMDDSTLHSILYVIAFFGADSGAMAEQQRWFAGKPAYENYGLAFASDAEAYVGHIGKARELIKPAVDT